ncbi:MAG: hypothetical protein PHD73_00875 [Sediminibacterium sp.]|nr:hypothetical protein [Sediminibacterium sp.]
MKLLFVTALKESAEIVAAIFKKADIRVYSATDTIGFKNGSDKYLLDNWFSSGDAKFDSIFLFSFTGEENADHALTLINQYNQEFPGDFPIRAFVMPVEKTSN